MKSLFVAIDVQKYFINKHTAHIPERIHAALQKIQPTIEVAFSKFINKQSSSFTTQLNWHKMYEGPEIEIIPPLDEWEDRVQIFEKTSYSIFKASGFNDYLRSKEIKQIYFAGIDTEACVLASAFDCFDRGLATYVVEDLCASHAGDELHNAALKVIRQTMGSSALINSDDLVR